MKANPPKDLFIKLTYSSYHELIALLNDVKKSVKIGELQNNGHVKGCPFSFSVSNHKTKTPDREETINGNLCKIYKSKINSL